MQSHNNNLNVPNAAPYNALERQQRMHSKKKKVPMF